MKDPLEPVTTRNSVGNGFCSAMADNSFTRVGGVGCGSTSLKNVRRDE